MGGAARAVLVAVTALSLPDWSQGLWWSISNGLDGAHLPDHGLETEAEIGRDIQLVALNKFDFGADGWFDYNVTVTLQDVQGVYQGNTVEGWRPYNESGSGFPAMMELMACSSAEYTNMYRADRAKRGSFCSIGRGSMCERFPLALQAEPVAGGPAWRGRAVRGRVDKPDTLFFVLNACPLARSFPLANAVARISAEYDFANGARFLSGQEMALAEANMALSNVFLTASLLWFFHCWAWSKTQDVTLQLHMGVVVSLKASLLALTVCSLYLKSVDADLVGSSVLYYFRMLLTTVYYLFFMYGLFLLAAGERITGRRANCADKRRALRLALAFALFAGIFAFTGRESVFLWILLMFLYIFLTSSIYQVATISMRGIVSQRSVAEDQLAGARALDLVAETRQLEKRSLFLAQTSHMFFVLRVAMALNFCVAPVVLMVVQMLMLRVGHSADRAPLVVMAEVKDLCFFLLLAYNFRVRSLSKYLFSPADDTPTGDASAADGSDSAGGAAASTSVDIEVQQTPSVSERRAARTVVVPYSASAAQEAATKPKPEAADKQDEQRPVISVSNFGETEHDINLGVSQAYHTADR